MLVHESVLGADNLVFMNVLTLALGTVMLLAGRSLQRAATVLACVLVGATTFGAIGFRLDADAAGLWICGTLGGLVLTLIGTGVLMMGHFVIGGLVTGGVMMILLPDLAEPGVLTDPWVVGLLLGICNIGGLFTAAARERGVVVATTVGGAVLGVDALAWLSRHDVVEAIVDTNLFSHKLAMLVLITVAGVWIERRTRRIVCRETGTQYA